MNQILLFLLFLLPVLGDGYLLGCRRWSAATGAAYSATPAYYGWYTVLWMFVPALLLSLVALASDLSGAFTPPKTAMLGLWVALPIVGLAIGLLTISPRLQVRSIVERAVYASLLIAALVSILTTVGIVLSVLFEAIRFFSLPEVSLWEFFTGTQWNPDTSFLGGAGRADEQVSDADFGSVPLFAGTFYVTAIAMAVAVPIGVLAAIFMAEYASAKVRKTAKPILEILAGIPTVVYGFFAAITVSPAIVAAAESLGVEASNLNALAPGLVMGIMIIPFMSSLSDDVITSVPQDLRRASLAVGATRAETIKHVVIPAALPGIVSAFLLAVSRAVGETMIVVMAIGLRPHLTANPLEEMTTVTVRIVDALVGDQEFDSPQTLSAFGLGLTLLVITLIFNIVAATIIRRFEAKYE